MQRNEPIAGSCLLNSLALCEFRGGHRPTRYQDGIQSLAVFCSQSPDRLGAVETYRRRTHEHRVVLSGGDITDDATAQDVAMFVSSSSVCLDGAEPVGGLTAKDRETLDAVLIAGGTVTAAEFA